jgi:PTH1 family peptidyl-tRNA hydrolase
MGTPIDLIVGLGNPGPEYEATRHNAGFWFVDLLAREHGGTFSRERKLHGEAAEIVIAGSRIRLLKPMTYMNLSGQSVGAAVSYYKIPTRLPPSYTRRKINTAFKSAELKPEIRLA